MNKLIKSAKINGEICAPPSKSMMQRVLAASLLSKNPTEILNPSFCDDALTALGIVESLGAKVDINRDKVFIKGTINPKKNVLNCRESGLCLRMFSPIVALCNKTLTLTASGSLCTRPISMVEKSLQDLGVKCETHNGYPPVRLTGPLSGGEIEVDGSISSQFLTGLLIALPVVNNNSKIYVKNLKSKPYIDMTLKFLAESGIQVLNTNYKTFNIKGKQPYKIGRHRIEGDWSGAAFLLVAGAIGGSITINGLNLNSMQGDKKILNALKDCGASLMIKNNSIKTGKKDLNAFKFDATECPDLFPPLVVLACNCKGRSLIKGIERLKYKESNRADVLKKEFSSIGASILIKGNYMEIKGKKLCGGTINSHNDHRIAMSAGLAALNTSNDVLIKDSECISKSYTDFFKDLKKLGVG